MNHFTQKFLYAIKTMVVLGLSESANTHQSLTTAFLIINWHDSNHLHLTTIQFRYVTVVLSVFDMTMTKKIDDDNYIYIIIMRDNYMFVSQTNTSILFLIH